MTWHSCEAQLFLMRLVLLSSLRVPHPCVASEDNGAGAVQLYSGTILPFLVSSGSPMAAPEQSFIFDHAGDVKISQEWSSGALGGSVWHAGIVLAHYVDEHSSSLLKHCVLDGAPLNSLSGCTALELGSGGSGLSSVVFARLGGRALASDGDADVIPLLEKNLWSNDVSPCGRPSWESLEEGAEASGGCAVGMHLRWGVEADMQASMQVTEEMRGPESVDGRSYLSGKPDILLGGDLVYPSNGEARLSLLNTFRSLAGPNTVILFAHTRRIDEVRGILVRLHSSSFTVYKFPLRCVAILPVLPGRGIFAAGPSAGLQCLSYWYRVYKPSISGSWLSPVSLRTRNLAYIGALVTFCVGDSPPSGLQCFPSTRGKGRGQIRFRDRWRFLKPEALCAPPPVAPSLQVGPVAVAAVGVGHLRVVRKMLV